MILEAGEATSAITMLEPLIATYPFRDRPRGLPMRALADAGRRTDAVREFKTYRHLLAEEVGTEPSPFLLVLDRAIVAQTGRPSTAHRHPFRNTRHGAGRAPPPRFAASLLARAQPPIGGGPVHRAQRRAGGG